MSETEELERASYYRVYAGKSAKTAHLIPQRAVNDQTGRSIHSSLCGRAWPWSSRTGWLGLESINNIDHAKALPLCRICERKSDRG
jgi:hypothetical protein